MKKFQRLLAMLLAIVMVLGVLPFSAFAANDWVSVDTNKTTESNVTSTDITLTVDPEALITYIKDRDLEALLTGVSVSGSLSDILTVEEILAIVPEEQIAALLSSMIIESTLRR